MSQENQSCLRFSLEESLWFRKGQEVEELVSISLDPDITIQENDQYVTIRGSLELTGEYKSYEPNNENEDEGVTSQKFVERVDAREGGTCEFSHRFPVDITIPNNRIQSIYDIDVLVESFDYSIPERSCLKLAADLTISGLYGTEQQQQKQQQPQDEAVEIEVISRTELEDVEEDAEEIEVKLTSIQSNYQDNFLFEAEARKPQEEEESVEILPKFPTFNYQPQEEAEEESNQPSWEYEEARNESNQPTWEYEEARSESNQPSWEYEEARSESNQPSLDLQEARIESNQPSLDFEEVRNEPKQPSWNFQQVRNEASQHEAAPQQVTEVEPAPTPTNQFEEEAQEVEESSSHEEAPPKNMKKKKAPKKKSMTLTEFFARKDESSAQAKVKVCIVQKGDTVNSVADRYDVSIQNLLRVNNLELTQDIFEGQVLYIPSSMAKK
ncbi:stage VI sporulation protein D [Neobacillus drentensis]|uniref:stage VI sporulation protein D n=1 Tax=Neobacillus drentensis TaxID=220684 RepID=UPI002854A59F|nr:stage VI sporulation protein D [Neobacillus drentensis]MDR7237419.1 stage VI sporulation protein D [Neobacillus drentensis]